MATEAKSTKDIRELWAASKEYDPKQLKKVKKLYQRLKKSPNRFIYLLDKWLNRVKKRCGGTMNEFLDIPKSLRDALGLDPEYPWEATIAHPSPNVVEACYRYGDSDTYRIAWFNLEKLAEDNSNALELLKNGLTPRTYSDYDEWDWSE